MQKKTYHPTHIANFFLWCAEQNNIKDMTPMKLIKLTYFSYAWALVFLDRKIFTEQIMAWRYGPVIPSLYGEFKEYGSKPIKKYAIDVDIRSGAETYGVVEQEQDEELVKVLNLVWDNYKDTKAQNMSDITHEKDSPWSKARNTDLIMKDEDIRKRAQTKIKEIYGDSYGS